VQTRGNGGLAFCLNLSQHGKCVRQLISWDSKKITSYRNAFTAVCMSEIHAVSPYYRRFYSLSIIKSAVKAIFQNRSVFVRSGDSSHSEKCQYQPKAHKTAS
jgi:hypothetical protein